MADSDCSIAFVPIPSSIGKRPFVDITGVKAGRLVVLGYAGTKGHNRYWFCKCECGQVKAVSASSIQSGATASCGCIRKEMLVSRNRVHGHAAETPKDFSPEYKAYRGAQKRCRSRSAKGYDRYGGRGILFNFDSFVEFLSCVGLRPSKDHSLDRINVNGHYEPGNVRWATSYVQQHNKRTTIYVEHDSEIVALAEVINSKSGEYQRVTYGITVLNLSPTEAMNRVLSTKAFRVAR